ncbi:type II toxin-antitoxin system RelE/ParE family toxin [Bradyrhizobium sp. Arg314]
MEKLAWSAFALSDRDGIFTHIEANNPAAAIAINERIVAVTRRLRDFPESGRPGRVSGTRELVIWSSGHCCAPCSTRRIRIVSPTTR